VYLICPTAKLQQTYRFIDKRFILSGASDETLLQIMKYQEEHEGSKAAVIIDDMVGLFDGSSKVATNLCGTSRQYRLSLFFLTQNLKKISTTIFQWQSSSLINRFERIWTVKTGGTCLGEQIRISCPKLGQK